MSTLVFIVDWASGSFEKTELPVGFSPVNFRPRPDNASQLIATLDKEAPEVLANSILVLLLTDADFGNCCSITQYSPTEKTAILTALLVRYPQLMIVVPRNCGMGLPRLGGVWPSVPDSNLNLHFPHIRRRKDSVSLADTMQPPLVAFANGYRAWFDPIGIRTYAKCDLLGVTFGTTACRTNTKQQTTRLCRRSERLLLAVDEELPFAALSAYTAWKFGWSSWMVTSYHALISSELRERAQNVAELRVLRDIDLRFADLDLKIGGLRKALMSVSAEAWSAVLKRCKAAPQVYAISSDPRVRDFRYAAHKFPPFTKEQSAQGEISDEGKPTHFLGLTKPIAGLYDLRDLLQSASGEQKNDPPKSVLAALPRVAGDAEGNHGAPYLNLESAKAMLAAARRCPDTTEGNVIAALLASEAYELLLGMSRTTALEALLVMHQAEVRAEMTFPGVSHDILIKRRREDVEATIDELLGKDSDIGDSDLKKRIKQTFLAQFWAQLRPLYSAGGQFPAAEASSRESLVNSGWLPASFREWPRIGRRFDWQSPLWVKHVLVSVATSFLSWTAACGVLVLGLVTAYGGVLEGRRLDFSGKAMSVFGSLAEQVALSSLELALTPHLQAIVDRAGHKGELLALSHLALSYLLFGLMISMLFRRVTRS